MADAIQIQLLDIYQPVTEKQIQEGKNFNLRREAAANGLAALIDALLKDAAEKITKICYRYGIDAKRFQLSSEYNEKMMKEVSDVLDELEDEILDLTASYATRCTKDKDKKSALWLWMLTLGKGGQGLKTTLENRLRTFAKDIEAMLVAAKTAKCDLTKAITLIKSHLHNVYQMQGMKETFKNASRYKAENIRLRGVKKGYRGSSNSEANNILRFAKATLQKAWMRYHRQLYEEQGAFGYYVLRGSTYPCNLCDSMTGLHMIDDVDGYPPYHPSCVCYTVPIFLYSNESF